MGVIFESIRFAEYRSAPSFDILIDGINDLGSVNPQA